MHEARRTPSSRVTIRFTRTDTTPPNVAQDTFVRKDLVTDGYLACFRTTPAPGTRKARLRWEAGLFLAVNALTGRWAGVS
jgi:hypothetical protein